MYLEVPVRTKKNEEPIYPQRAQLYLDLFCMIQFWFLHIFTFANFGLRKMRQDFQHVSDALFY